MSGRFKAADWGKPSGLGFRFQQLNWSKPVILTKGERPSAEGPGIYAFTRTHGNAYERDIIEYIGLTANAGTRFSNHGTGDLLIAKGGSTAFSFASVTVDSGPNREARLKTYLEQIEHILIWAALPRGNDRKYVNLPGSGTANAERWHIKNTGYRFRGAMPKEILFPWMAVVAGTYRP